MYTMRTGIGTASAARPPAADPSACMMSPATVRDGRCLARAVPMAIPAGWPVASDSATAEAQAAAELPQQLAVQALQVKPEETPRCGLPLDIARRGHIAGTTHADQPGGRVRAHPQFVRGRRVRRHRRYLLTPDNTLDR